MPHHVGAEWSEAARCATAFALLFVCGCTSDDAKLLVIVTHGTADAALASPIDPRPFRTVTASPSLSGPLAKSIARYYAVLDSADSLDRTFQHEREALNRDARRLTTAADRRSPAYAREYDSFMRRMTIAARTREARDRVRRRAGSLRAELGDRLPGPARDRGDQGALHSALDSVARGRGQRVHRVILRDRHATFDLRPGVWWILVEHRGGIVGGLRRHDVRPGARDTLRIGE